MPAHRKMGSRELAAVAARVMIREGLSYAQERLWERMAEPGDPIKADCAEALRVKSAIEPRALRIAAVEYGGFSVSLLAHAVKAELERTGKSRAASLETENDRLRAENEWLRAQLAAREAAE